MDLGSGQLACAARHLALNLLHILNTLDLEGVVIGRLGPQSFAEKQDLKF